MVNNLIVCGGTFDHFHKGHRALLKLAFSLGRKVVIGVTSDSYVKNSKSRIQNSPLRPAFAKASAGKQGFEWQAKLIEPFEERKEAVLDFVKKEGVINRVKIVEIGDLFGPTLSKNFPIDVIVVSQDTKKGAEIINKKRKELELKDLKILVAPLVLAEDGEIISSERIRKGEIDREGRLYVKPSFLKTGLVLPENLRGEFRKPFGELFDIDNVSESKNSLIITVGDITTKILNEKSLGQNMSVIDFKVAREKKFENIQELGFAGDEVIFNADNPAGHITHSLFSKIESIFKSGFGKRIILKIEGEEDLAVLPLVLLAPLNTIIYYGQPHKGLVKITVSEKAKNKAHNLILRLKIV